MAAEMGYSAGFLALTRLEAGDPVGARGGARAHRGGHRRPPTARGSGASAGPSCCSPRGGYEEAVATTIEIEQTRPPGTHPVWSPWRTQRARALAALGDREQALALAREELELARGDRRGLGHRPRAAAARASSRARTASSTCARPWPARRPLGAARAREGARRARRGAHRRGARRRGDQPRAEALELAERCGGRRPRPRAQLAES